MSSSQNKMIAQLFQRTSAKKTKQVNSTIAFRFRKQLRDLIDRLERSVSPSAILHFHELKHKICSMHFTASYKYLQVIPLLLMYRLYLCIFHFRIILDILTIYTLQV